jgi:hypothetical protein
MISAERFERPITGSENHSVGLDPADRCLDRDELVAVTCKAFRFRLD